ncbi:MAG: helicase [Sulfurimonas sp. RIFCSPLOWO2_12_36_12]|uniref:DEAD/DEAH box helicase n=1 Tax=Sulfurimonas sp. RIFCSPLOWO2_12_36_12 TaxID=1802253 RepID=UPI0008B0F438|nr:DEAD/DEAH box helicase [Sulfurimonas sp. RIFCSPLOWO2_12_36_12]OHD98148.1 MAG: helicase [Sulfurimonas sp. RIFCSPLOWO2_02_FULL_36_28]OHE00318.1 MAG: helicase [Sulfurimonas sp. RIFCSPLOWO2_12_36_12]
MSFIEELANDALYDDYLIELFFNAEKQQAQDLFQIEQQEFTKKEFIDLLRFADILSHSNSYQAQNKAYKIISLLIDKYTDDEVFQTFANSIMTKLGNFPALSLFEKTFNSEIKQSYETLLEKSIKETYQQIPESEFIFTDTQYEIFELLKNHNHFSFSGPTSLGKSFIINAFIRYLITEHRGTDNLVILVPSRALINQTVTKLKQDFKDESNYTILAHPTVPTMFRSAGSRYIFVFTPERLIAYLSNSNNPKLDYLFVDEAQKIISQKDTRSPLYYHAILQAERKSIKLYFASPNIQNPEIFLQLFEKSTDEKIAIKTAPVAQNRFFLDLIDRECLMFSDNDRDYTIPINLINNDFFFWLEKLGKEDKNIIYCNSKADTVMYALGFAKNRPIKKDKALTEAIELVKEYLHDKYYLIDCLEKGIAFHFGNLPQLIREKIEQLFENKVIDYLFSTSTLLEGVNLPAKNIFILVDKIGNSKFTDMDFWNLAGRAGRMTKEMSGNIICMRVKESQWMTGSNNPHVDLELIKNKNIKKIEPLIVKGQEKFYKNIEASLTNNAFTSKSASQNKKDIWDYYANLVLLHEIKQDDSILRTNFISKNKDAVKILHELKKHINVPEKILSASSMIKAQYQNNIFNDSKLSENILPDEFDYDVILKNLTLLSNYYNWGKEESGGRNPMYPTPEKLKYYAVLMDDWMKSKPLKMIIASSIKYYRKKGVIWDTDHYEEFDSKGKKHINMVVNEVIASIDNLLRFKLKNYFENYNNILKEKLGIENSGANWADYLEYGTTDFKVIELQNIGIPRHLAQYFLEHHEECLIFDNNNNLIEVNHILMNNNFDKATHEYKEFKDIFTNLDEEQEGL